MAGSGRGVEELRRVLAHQDGVVTRAQVLATGLKPPDLERLLRHRDLVRVHDGVYVDHTGALTWRQRAWVGTLRFSGALAGQAALRAAMSTAWRHLDERAPIEIAVPAARHLRPVEGYVFVRTDRYADRVLAVGRPPRLRPEHAVLALASTAVRREDRHGAVGLLADACQTRRTTAARILEALDSRRQLVGKAWLRAVLVDIDAGTCSVLEHAYLDRIERAHGLPTARRQLGVATPTGLTASVRRDVDYEELGLVVELDGGLFHDNATQRDADLDRDLDATIAVAGGPRTTVRLGWGQVVGRPCATAAKLGALLQRLGWTGEIAHCDRCGQLAA